MSWNEKRIGTLKKLWEKGLTASQIAGELGEVTRNAVIGKAHRLGLSGRPSPLKNNLKPAPAARPVSVREEPPGKKITLLMLTDRMCKWPIGHPGDDDFHFCGGKAATSQPYCAQHAAMAYQERAPKRDRKPRPSGPGS